MNKVHFHLDPIELLFEGWRMKSASDIAIAAVVSALLAVLMEASKSFVLYFLIVTPEKATFRLRLLCHIARTLLHVVQLGIGYLLMLMVMTFNFWIMLSVILGSGVGYLSCGWTQSKTNNKPQTPSPKRVKKRTPPKETEATDTNNQLIVVRKESSL